MTKYEEFQLDWLKSHNHSIPELIRELSEFYEETLEIDPEMSVEAAFNEWQYSIGFGSEIWPCEEEYNDCEEKNSSSVLSIVDNNKEAVVIGIDDLSEEDIERFPYLSKDYCYFSISKGEDRVLNVITNVGAFGFPLYPEYRIPDKYKTLVKEIVNFLWRKYIFINLDTLANPDLITVKFDQESEKWQVTVEAEDKIEHVHLPEFRSREDCVRYVRNKGSKYDGPKGKIAKNGDVVFEFTLKKGIIF
ncbi:hypothetical protein M2146_001029 [Lachnospiraceae bacterium PF1-22]